MKHLFEYLIGGKKIGRAARYNFQPQTKEELQKLITELITERGMDGDFNDIDTSQITDMSNLFKSTNSFDFSDFNGDISEWNTSNVKNMYVMFYGCKKFNGDISGWDVGNVTDMYGMFYKAENFNGDISKWDISKAKNMYSMFYGCKKFNQDISEWDVSNVKMMEDIFNGCPILEEFKPKFNK